MAQTPTQRLANARYAKMEEKKMGTYRAPKADPETRKKMSYTEKFRGGSSVQKGMVYLLVFMLVGGIFFELLRVIFFKSAY